MQQSMFLHRHSTALLEVHVTTAVHNPYHKVCQLNKFFWQHHCTPYHDIVEIHDLTIRHQLLWSKWTHLNTQMTPRTIVRYISVWTHNSSSPAILVSYLSLMQMQGDIIWVLFDSLSFLSLSSRRVNRFQSISVVYFCDKFSVSKVILFLMQLLLPYNSARSEYLNAKMSSSTTHITRTTSSRRVPGACFC